MAQPPTSHLPPIARIATFTSTQLFESLEYLHSLYLPRVRGSRRRRRKQHEDVHDDDDIEIRCDAFERAYAIRWLTALIAQLETPTDNGIQPPTSSSDTDTLIQQAASLLAICAGVAAAPKLHRRFSFQLHPGAEIPTRTIHVDLTDIPLDNHNYASVGAQTWGGACVLAEMIAERPDRFGLGCVLRTTDDKDDGLYDGRVWDHPLRILELGAGTGLVGLTVAKLVQASLSSRNANLDPLPRATIVLTDFYPAVLANLQSNIDTNFPTPASPDPPIAIHSHPLDWFSFSSTIDTETRTETQLIPNVLSTPFDLVFGADIIYEAQHAIWIRDCLVSLLSYPDGSGENPVFHLVIPLRPTHAFESGTVEEVFGSKERGLGGSQRVLTVLSKETIVCEAYGDGRSERSRADDDVEYVYYQIGWSR